MVNVDGRTDKRMDRQTDGWTDEQTDGNLHAYVAHAKAGATKIQNPISRDLHFPIPYQHPILNQFPIFAVMLLSIVWYSGTRTVMSRTKDVTIGVCVCEFGFNVAFNNFSVISRRCLVATGSSMLTFIVLPH